MASSSLPLLLVLRTMSRVSATHDEEASARAAATEANTGAPTIFDKIIQESLPDIVYEVQKVLAFLDINPQDRNVLVIPKLRDGLTELGKAEPRHEDFIGSSSSMRPSFHDSCRKEGHPLIGFRVVINSGGATACTLSIGLHLHLHVLGGRQLKWPPG
ncbi:14 kDa zinc-binding protein-like protein [Tanacetum coccineum]